ncbi:MAG: sigma-70 family RNA polymerase sigma factor, partial [Chloroflexota bacterium]|nr:sigma-70 family RNA polymerase sigma factor [Chloroflexota bacterium]
MDCELVDRAREGDREAFALIVDASFDRCHEIARRILGESHLAQDATQQAMLSIWRDLPKLRDAARFEAWSYRITVNACYAEAKRARRTLPEIYPTDHGSAISDENGTIIDRDQLDRAFSRQKLEHRAVLVLRYYLDMPVEEVASTL